MGQSRHPPAGSVSQNCAPPVAPEAFLHAGPKAWYIARLKPTSLSRAEINLHRQGYPTFMPRRQVGERRNGKIRQVIRPLFPGYLFVQIDRDRQHWKAINNTYGVARIVALDRITPSQVPEPLMAGLFARCDGDSWRPEAEALAPGTPVRLAAGAFAGTLARIATFPEADRVYVLLDMMGQSVRTRVAVRDLEPI